MKVRIFIIGLFLIGLSISAIAQNEKLVIINQVPEHLPLKVSIRTNETESKNENVEIEITNTGDKFIYFLYLNVSTIQKFSTGGLSYAVSLLYYGRMELIDNSELAVEGDEFLKPDESVIFKIKKTKFEKIKNLSSQAQGREVLPKYILRFQFLNFGDGTGYISTGGTPIGKKKN